MCLLVLRVECTVRGQEGAFTARNGQTFYGFIGNNYYFGRDLNGDGDVLDRFELRAREGR